MHKSRSLPVQYSVSAVSLFSKGLGHCSPPHSNRANQSINIYPFSGYYPSANPARRCSWPRPLMQILKHH